MRETFKIQRRIEFAETDMAGIVHFSNFFRMMEATEHAFLRMLGFGVHQTSEVGTTGWPRVKASCEYLRPIRFEDIVEIELAVAEVRNRSVCYRFEFHKTESAGVELVARGEMVAVYATVNVQRGSLGAEAIPVALKDALLRYSPEG